MKCLPLGDPDTQSVAKLRFQPRFAMGLATFDLCCDQAGNDDKGYFSKMEKLKPLAHNSLSTPNAARCAWSKRILRALCNPHKAEDKKQGSPLSLGCLPGSCTEPLPPWPPPGQDSNEKSQENKAHIFPCEAGRPLLAKQWPCWGSKELGPSSGQRLSPSLIRMTTCSPLLSQMSPLRPTRPCRPHLPAPPPKHTQQSAWTWAIALPLGPMSLCTCA